MSKELAAMAPEKVFEDVGPTEDVVHALMELLVDPKLPYPVSITEPSTDAQNSVAKQMHAVFLLYNYYYRKKKPELEFLDFVSFCKLTLSRRATLNVFMKATSESELNLDNECRLSVTEKAVKEACDIAVALDASRDFPNIESWPITKVAVLVIDSEKENCLLRFGSVTEGVWSLIEKDVDKNLGISVWGDNKVGMKRKSNIQKANDNYKLLQIAFDAVEGITGIDRVDLVFLESQAHDTYSLSKEKSAVKFYMMQYCKTFDTKQRTPLKFLVESLRGPLVRKYSDGWEATESVAYYEMLPYVKFVSDWVSKVGKDLCLTSLNDHHAPSVAKSGGVELSRTRVAASSSTSSSDLKSSQNAVTNSGGIELSSSRVTASSSSPSSADLKCSPPEQPPCQNAATKKKKNTPNTFTQRSEVSEDSVKEKININSDTLDSISGCTKTSRKKLNSSQVVHNQKSDQHGANLQSDVADHMKSNATLALVQYEDLSVIDAKPINKPDPEDLKSALALLYRKRLELSSKIVTMQDALALHEDCVERIRDGGDVHLARQCLDSIMSGNTDLFPPKTEVKKQSGKFPNIFLPGRSSCQDLEYTCLKNNWRLPRYIVEPSDGKFLSLVVVGSKDFELCLKGDLEKRPSEARESGAAEMISKLREHFSGY